APATDENTRCGSPAARAAAMIAFPCATSASTPDSNGVVRANAAAAPRMAAVSAATSVKSPTASSAPAWASDRAPRAPVSLTSARTGTSEDSSAEATAPPCPPVAPSTSTGAVEDALVTRPVCRTGRRVTLQPQERGRPAVALPTAEQRGAGVTGAYRGRMDVIQLLPRLYFIRFPVGHAYLWSDPDGLTLIDTGLPGAAPLLRDAIRQTGHEPGDLRRVVLTHFHPDHIGAAADIAEQGQVAVLAHQADAPFVRAAGVGPAPDLADW